MQELYLYIHRIPQTHNLHFSLACCTNSNPIVKYIEVCHYEVQLLFKLDEDSTTVQIKDHFPTSRLIYYNPKGGMSFVKSISSIYTPDNITHYFFRLTCQNPTTGQVQDKLEMLARFH